MLLFLFMFLFISPLEQFLVIKIWSFGFNFFYLTNINIFCFLFLFNFFFLKNIFLFKLSLIPTWGQVLIELAYMSLLNLVILNTNLIYGQFFYLFFALTFFLFFSNLAGLIPFFFTVTSSAIIVFFFSFSFFFGFNLIGIFLHKYKMFNLFLPKNTPFFIIFILFLIEFVSYISRVFSLSIRLIANLVGGHSLLLILISFSLIFFFFGFFSFFLNVGFLLGIHLICVLEFIIAFLQIYIFIVLLCLYVQDTIFLGH